MHSKILLWLCLVFFLAAEVRVAAGFNSSPTRLTATHHLSRQTSSTSRRRSWTQVFAVPNLAIESDTESVEEVPKTMAEALDRFFLGPDRGPICVVGILTGFLSWRGMMMESSVGSSDALVFATAVVFWWFQEHVMHERVLHSDVEWFGKEIHRGHHNKPYFHVSIDPAGLILGWLAVAHVVLRLLLPADLAVSASIGYAGSGLIYEWAHYVSHTRVKPFNEFWKQVRDNHIKHHMVDNRYWFAFSLPAIDDWFGTNPPVHEVKSSKR
jgi:hypothetical protein